MAEDDEIQDVSEADTADAAAQEDGSNQYADIKAHVDAGEELSDQELDTIADLAIAYLRDILGYFGETSVSIDEYDGDDGELILDISGGDLAVLIGRHGRTLDALQMVLSSYLSNTLKFHYPVVVDIEGYKSRRREKLENLAHSAAQRAVKQHGSASLAPMNAYERRIVHMALAGDDRVTTHSVGEDPDRRVVVTAV